MCIVCDLGNRTLVEDDSSGQVTLGQKNFDILGSFVLIQ